MTADLQGDLFGITDITQPDYAPHLSIDERFAVWHQANPNVYRALERLTEQHVARGRTHLSIGMFVEVLRNEHDLNTTGDRFKINADYRALYSRLLMARHPEWDGLFATRERKAAA